VTNCTAQFSCLNSVSGKQPGDVCGNADYGVPTCGDRQACILLAGEQAGTCRAYCELNNPDRGCLDSYQCGSFNVGQVMNAPVIYVCVPVPVDGGGLDANLNMDTGTSAPDITITPPDAG
jgi:hypothetical protein